MFTFVLKKGSDTVSPQLLLPVKMPELAWQTASVCISFWKTAQPTLIQYNVNAHKWTVKDNFIFSSLQNY